MKVQSYRAFFLTLIAAFSWAVSIVATKMAMNAGENLYVFTLWSTIITFLIWIPVFFKSIPKLAQLKVDIIGLCLFIGAGKAVISLTENLAIAYTTAINFSFLIRTIIVFTMVFAALFLKEKITLKKLALACIILLGSYLLTTKGQGIRFSQGDIFTLIEAATIALINNVLLKKLINRIDVDLATVITFIIGSFFLTITTTSRISFQLPHQLGLIIISVLFGNIIMSLTRNRAYQYASASFVTMIISFTPVFVSLMSFALLKESLSTIQIVGGILIVSTGFLAQLLKI